MKCNLCGATIEDGSEVCPVCNEKCHIEDEREKTRIDNNTPERNNELLKEIEKQQIIADNFVTDEFAVELNTTNTEREIYCEQAQQDEVDYSSNYPSQQNADGEQDFSVVMPVAEKPQKKTKAKISGKKKAIIIVSAIVAFIALVGSLLYIFRAAILMWIWPKEYAAYCLSNTIDSLDKDVDTLMDEYLGFSLDKNTDFTLDNTLKLENSKTPFSNAKISYAPSRKTVMANLENVEFFGENVKMDVLWNDDIVGLHIPELSEDKYFAVKSKEFGNQVMNTNLSFVKEKIEEEKIDLSGTDISFSNIMGESALTEKEKEALKEEIVDSVKTFVEAGKVEEKGKSTKIIDGEEESVHTLTVSFEGGDVKDFLLDTISIVENDEAVKRQSGEKLKEYTADIKNKLKNANFDYEVFVDFELADDKAVTVNVRVPSKKITMSLDIDSLDVMLNRVKLAVNTPTINFDISTDGNIIPKNDKTDCTVNINYGGKYICIDAELDFDTNKAIVGLDTSEIDKIVFSGSCTRANGFSMDLKSGDNVIDFSLMKGATIAKLTGYEYMLLEKTEGLALVMELGDIVKTESGRNIVIAISKEYLGEDNTIINIIDGANSIINSFTGGNSTGGNGGFLSGLFN